MHDLLEDKIFRVIFARSEHSACQMSLPEILAALVRDEIDSFPALRPHQRAAWHMFLAQLGAIAIHSAGLGTVPDEAREWTRILKALTPGSETEAWSLVVDDLDKPAFLQPPVPERSLAGFKNEVSTADALDVLITSKNFDIKSEIARQSALEDWVFALISLQTMEGFLGAGNYGIARMNGGFSARCFLGLTPAEGAIGAHVRFDIERMLSSRDDLFETGGQYREENGLALVWLAAWDGKSALSMSELDPWFIEICRRVRFVEREGALLALAMGTKSPRLAAKDLNGVTGDFWAPVNTAENKAISLDARGFSSRVLSSLLFGDNFRLPPAVALTVTDTGLKLVCRGSARGQGKTEGYFERTIPFRKQTLLAMRRNKAEMAVIAEKQIKEIAQIAGALRLACAVVASGGADDGPRKEHYDLARPFTLALDQEAEAGFFGCLQDRLAEGESAKAPYLRALVATARTQLNAAANGLPCPSLRRERARYQANSAFQNKLWGRNSPLSEDHDLIMEKSHAQ
nr:hypothetical protein [uncultured Cohaesibacter sp.]